MTLVVTVLKALSVFVLGTLRNMEYYTQHVLPFNTTCQLYRDPGKGKVIADCTTTTPVAFIFTTYCLFLMFYRFM